MLRYILFALLIFFPSSALAESLSDGLIIRDQAPIYLMSGKKIECQKIIWIVETTDYIQCRHRDCQDEFQLDIVDLEKTFGEAIASEYAQNKADLTIKHQEAKKNTEKIIIYSKQDDSERTQQRVKPISFSSGGSRATDLFSLKKGLIKISYSHNGDGNFIIWLMDDVGEKIDLVVNEIGKCNGSKAVKIERPGSYLFNIDADPDSWWDIDIQESATANHQDLLSLNCSKLLLERSETSNELNTITHRISILKNRISILLHQKTRPGEIGSLRKEVDALQAFQSALKAKLALNYILSKKAKCD